MIPRESYLRIKTLNAQFQLESNSFPLGSGETDENWTVGWVVPIMVIVQVTFVVPSSLELFADSALTIVPTQAIRFGFEGGHEIGSPVVEVIWGGGKVATSQADFRPAAESGSCTSLWGNLAWGVVLGGSV